MFLPPLENIISNRACLRTRGGELNHIKQIWKWTSKPNSLWERLCYLMWEEKLLVLLRERLESGGLWPEHMPHTRELWGWSRDRHVCVFESGSGFWGILVVVEEGWEFVDAHHMGSCGPRASVGGWAPAGTGLCCNHSDPWRPAAAVVEPAVWRSSSCLPSDWTSPLQEQTGKTITENITKTKESVQCNHSPTHKVLTKQKQNSKVWLQREKPLRRALTVVTCFFLVELQEPPHTCLVIPWKPKVVFPVATPTVCFTNTALG